MDESLFCLDEVFNRMIEDKEKTVMGRLRRISDDVVGKNRDGA